MEKKYLIPRLGQAQHLFWTGLALAYGIQIFFFLFFKGQGATMKRGTIAIFCDTI
jgi:hypothetical protein